MVYELHRFIGMGLLLFCVVAESEVADSVSGILMMQDLQLGTLVALLPFFEGWSLSKEEAEPQAHSWLMRSLQLLQVLFGFPLLVLVFRVIASRTGDRFHK